MDHLQSTSSTPNGKADDYDPRILIHAPYGGKKDRLGSWDALVEAQCAGKVKSIGVSNYGIHHLEELEEYIKTGGGGEISAGQYELHPWLDHSDIAEWLQTRGIVVEAYSPLAHGTRFREPVLQTIGKKYNKSPAQVLIRWSLQMVSAFLPYLEPIFYLRICSSVDEVEADRARDLCLCPSLRRRSASGRTRKCLILNCRATIWSSWIRGSIRRRTGIRQ